MEKSSRLKFTRHYGVFSTGNLDISRVEVASPTLSVHLPEPGDEPFNFDEIEAQHPCANSFICDGDPRNDRRLSGAVLLEVRIGDRPPVMITELEGRLVAPPGAMQIADQFPRQCLRFVARRGED